jgi:hypothetical protein
MHNEPLLIMLRRFTGRILESGLLILLVALGVGAASAGVSISLNSASYAADLRSRASYHEIAVSVPSQADTMEEPVIRRPTTDTTILTYADLSAAELLPAVDFAYIENPVRLSFVNEAVIERDAERRAQMEQVITSEARETPDAELPEGPPESMRMDAEDLEEAAQDDSIIIARIEELSGSSVSSEFFTSRALQTTFGSLFSTEDYQGTESVIILGHTAAQLLLPEGMTTGELIGKRVLTRTGYVTIVGILPPDGSPSDSRYYAPYQDTASSLGFTGIRRSSMGTVLRFYVTDEQELDATAEQLENWFTSQFGENQIVISNPKSEADQLIARNSSIGILMLLLSGAGLFIAAINVSHMLISRAMRMRRHVGILMALGSSRGSIRRLFTWESLGITGIGTLFGALFAIPLNASMQRAMSIQSDAWWAIALGAILSAVLILLFSLVPIMQYTRIQPADAMRNA